MQRDFGEKEHGPFTRATRGTACASRRATGRSRAYRARHHHARADRHHSGRSHLHRPSAVALRHQRPIRQRQIDAAQPADRHRPAHERAHRLLWSRDAQDEREQARQMAWPACRRRLPVLPALADAHRAGEHPARARTRRRHPAQGVARRAPTRRCAWWG